jgi:hypothetical protein
MKVDRKNTMRGGEGVLLACWALASWIAPVMGQDNPVLRSRLQQKIVEELAEHHSQETAWYSEKSVNKQKWTKGKLIGRPIRLASWTEESKTWVWLEDPARLAVNLTRLEFRDGRVHFALTARGKARFKAWGRIPKLAKGMVGGTMDVEIDVAGSSALGTGGLTGSSVPTFTGRLHDLRFNNDLGHPFEDLVKDALNRYIENHSDKLRASMEKAIDRVKF